MPTLDKTGSLGLDKLSGLNASDRHIDETPRICFFSILLWKHRELLVQRVRPTQEHKRGRIQTRDLAIDSSWLDTLSYQEVEALIMAAGLQTMGS